MKNLLTILFVGASCMLGAQTVSSLKTFKNKEAKLRAGNLFDLKVNEGNIALIAEIKKGTAEQLTFTSELVLVNRTETNFDFAMATQKRREIFNSSSGVEGTYSHVAVDVLKSDVLQVTSADALSKTLGVNTVNKTKIGLKSGLGFAIQKGDIQFVTNVMGDRVRTFTTFVSREEIKLKSEEGKSITYEFHSSAADALQLEFKESDTYNKSKIKTMQSFINQEGDLLLIGKRRPVIKFGKAPNDEDLMPVYYVYKLSPKTMDIIEQTVIKEPVSRGIIFRESLPVNKGILLISAPLDITGEKIPKDKNPRNYVFRLIGNDTKVKFELTHEVPSGYTQFSQAFELADKSIVLVAAITEKKKDKFFNQGTYLVPGDAYYIMTIKEGKVTNSQKLTAEAFNMNYIIPPATKAGKYTYNPACELTTNIAHFDMADGGLVSAWRVTRNDNGILKYSGDIVLQFAADGKLTQKYFKAAQTDFVPEMTSVLWMKDNNSFYLLTHVANDKGELEESTITQIDIVGKTMGVPVLLGDEKHILSNKFPYFESSASRIQFFGFDKSGKEFWTQQVELN
jgi:hypothetical protein